MALKAVADGNRELARAALAIEAVTGLADDRVTARLAPLHDQREEVDLALGHRAIAHDPRKIGDRAHEAIVARGLGQPLEMSRELVDIALDRGAYADGIRRAGQDRPRPQAVLHVRSKNRASMKIILAQRDQCFEAV